MEQKYFPTPSMESSQVIELTRTEPSLVRPDPPRLPLLPDFRIDLPLHMKSQPVKDLFLRLCPQFYFEVLEQEKGESVLAVSHKSLSLLKNLLQGCVPYCCMRGGESLVRLNIQVDQQLCKKVVSFKGLSGDHTQINAFLNHFQHDLLAMLASVNDQDRLDSQQSLCFEGQPAVRQVSVSLESYSYYHFYKVLCCRKYSIGKQVASFLESPLPDTAQALLEHICLDINRTSDLFFQEYNYAKSETRQLMPYCFLSVEKYYFSALGGRVAQLYRQALQPQETRFVSRRAELQSKQNYRQQLAYLEIRPKFRLETEEYPYGEAVDELDRLNIESAPHQQLKQVLNSYNQIKVGVVGYFQSQEDVYTMDDELPLIIYVVANTANMHLLKSLHMLHDYYALFSDHDNELRILTNYKVACEYIQDSWHLP